MDPEALVDAVPVATVMVVTVTATHLLKFESLTKSSRPVDVVLVAGTKLPTLYSSLNRVLVQLSKPRSV